MQLLPMIGMGSSVVFFFMPGMPGFMRIMGALMLASTLGMVIAQIVRYRRGTQGEMAQSRRDYLKYLAQTRRRIRRTAASQRSAQHYLHPAPDQLWAVVAEGSRVWERRIGDADFGQARIGLGTQQLATPLVAPDTAPVDELEPLTAGVMQRFLTAHGSLPHMPVAVSMRAFYHLTVSGDPEAAHGAARALIGQLVTLHSPQDLMVAVVAAPGAVARWEWTKWLPHAQLPGSLDGAGTKRLFGDDLAELETLLGDQLADRPRFSREAPPLLDRPHLVIVLDGGMVPPDSAFAAPEGLQGVTVVEVVPGELDEPRGGLSVQVHPARLRLESAVSVYDGTPDTLSLERADTLARRLAPLRIEGTDDDEPLLANLDFTDLLDLGDPASVDTARTWRPRSQAERLRVPIGVDEAGRPIMLDLKEAAQNGMGPHGLCVGATGSGKSELLRTLVLGLSVTHSSETLNFVLADFKGGATFAGMSALPHVAAVITNLADDLSLVDRMGDSIRGELQRRQELLRQAGNFANVHDYEKARAAGHALDPLSSLVIVIDEFSELLTAKPDFIEMFIQIGRIGRSLGVHLLLASQRLEEGRLRGLDTYLSYRIGLRTFSGAESRVALGVPDAYHLPSVPGSGYLKFGTDEMTRFKAAYVSGHVPLGHRGRGRGPAPRPAARRALPGAARPAGRHRAGSGHRPEHGYPSRARGRPRRHRAGRDRRPAGGPGPGRPPGLATAPGQGPRPRPAPARPGDHARTRPARPVLPRHRRADRPPRPGRQALRTAPRNPRPRLLRSHRPSPGRRRPPVRQVHAAAHPHRRVRAHPHRAGSPVLRARLRRRRPELDGGPPARRLRRLPPRPRTHPPYRRGGRGHPGAAGGVLPGPLHRHHRHLPPPARGRAASRTSPGAMSFSSSTAGAPSRTSTRCSNRSSPTSPRAASASVSTSS